MTAADFITLHTAGVINNINNSTSINVLYDNLTNGRGTIVGITVTLNAAFYNNFDTPPETNIETILEQVETIAFTFDETTYALEVVNNTLYNAGNNPFYYYEVTSDDIIPDVNDADILLPENNVIVNFEPFLSGIIFRSSDWNPLRNNGNRLRTSTVRLEADREIGSARPSNFGAILSTSASKAQVQDSFYSDTGLTNARYNGSKSTPTNYGGVSPSFTAKEFKGEIHPGDVNRDIACGTLDSARVIVDLLHTGENSIPGYTTGSAGIQTSTHIDADATIITYQNSPLLVGQIRPTIDEGDILGVDDSEELLRVREHNTFTNKLRVQRGYLGTQSSTIPQDTGLIKTTRTDVYRVDEFNRDLIAINNSVIFVQDDNTLAYTDDFGAIYSSSLCPVPTQLYLGAEDLA